MPGAAALNVSASRRAALRRRLLAWWDAGHRDLPWRFPQRAADAYRVWLAEVMLQQTQVAAVVPYYRRFVERFPTLAALAAAPEEEVLVLWSGLGYYARGRRLHAAAREALARHGGLPADAAALRALPGFGPYTAGAVASIAFALPEPCVDGNVARVLSRLFLVEGAPEDAAVRERLGELAAALVHPSRPGDWNQALMELGAMVCAKPAPRCERCPLARLCQARRAGREREVPRPRLRRPPRPLEVACAVIERGGAVVGRGGAVVGRRGALLVARRRDAGLFARLWELPSAEVDAGCDPRIALRAALARLGVKARVGAPMARVERLLTHRRLALTAYACHLLAPLPRRTGLRLASPAEREALAMPTAVRRLLAALPPPGTEVDGRARGRGARGRRRLA